MYLKNFMCFLHYGFKFLHKFLLLCLKDKVLLHLQINATKQQSKKKKRQMVAQTKQIVQTCEQPTM